MKSAGKASCQGGMSNDYKVELNPQSIINRMCPHLFEPSFLALSAILRHVGPKPTI
jgi:hypothetical protein